jgi:hypothetical protein
MQNNRIRKTLKLFILTGIGLIFLTLGIHLLISAYECKDPFSFIMIFFAGNFVILISATLTFGFIWHLWRLARGAEKNELKSPGKDRTIINKVE